MDFLNPALPQKTTEPAGPSRALMNLLTPQQADAQATQTGKGFQTLLAQSLGKPLNTPENPQVTFKAGAQAAAFMTPAGPKQTLHGAPASFMALLQSLNSPLNGPATPGFQALKLPAESLNVSPDGNLVATDSAQIQAMLQNAPTSRMETEALLQMENTQAAGGAFMNLTDRINAQIKLLAEVQKGLEGSQNAAPQNTVSLTQATDNGDTPFQALSLLLQGQSQPQRIAGPDGTGPQTLKLATPMKLALETHIAGAEGGPTIAAPQTTMPVNVQLAASLRPVYEWRASMAGAGQGNANSVSNLLMTSTAMQGSGIQDTASASQQAGQAPHMLLASGHPQTNGQGFSLAGFNAFMNGSAMVDPATGGDAGGKSTMKDFAQALSQIQPGFTGQESLTNTAKTAQAQSQTQPQPHPASEQVRVQLSRMAGTGQNSVMRMDLNPPELGKVQIRMEFGRDRSVRAVLTVEKPETLTMLQRDSLALGRALQDAGLEVSDNTLEFNLQQDNAQSESGSGHPDQARNPGQGGPGGSAQTKLEETHMDLYADPETGQLRVNMLV